MGAREKIDELIASVAGLADGDQRRACLAQLDQLLLAESPPPRERPPLVLTNLIGATKLLVVRPD